LNRQHELDLEAKSTRASSDSLYPNHEKHLRRSVLRNQIMEEDDIVQELNSGILQSVASKLQEQRFKVETLLLHLDDIVSGSIFAPTQI